MSWFHAHCRTSFQLHNRGSQLLGGSPVESLQSHFIHVCEHFANTVRELLVNIALGPRADNVIIPLDLTQLFCPGFMLTAGPPSRFTTDGVSCWGGALWRACNLTSFSPCLTGPVNHLFATRHKGPRFKSPRGYLCETRILLLALSRNNVYKVRVDITKLVLEGHMLKSLGWE